MRDSTGSPWDAVGGDPASGDPDAFAIWAKRFGNVADATADAAREMRRVIGLVDDGIWVGDAADVFRARARYLLERLEAEHDADAASADALSRFGQVLREAQRDALVGLDHAVGPEPDDVAGRALQGTRSVYGLAPTPGAPPEVAALTRAADDLRERIRAAEDRAIEAMEAAVPRVALQEASDLPAGTGQPEISSASDRAAAIVRLSHGALRSNTDRRHLSALLLDAAAKAGRDPAYAAALLSALGVDGVRRLLARLASLDETEHRTLLVPVGALLTAAKHDRKGRALIDDVVSSDTWRLDLLIDADLDNETAWALALVLLKCDPGDGQLHKDPARYQRQALEFLARRPDLALRYANEHTDQLMTYLGLSDARSKAAAQILAVGVTGPLLPAHEPQVDAALERVMAAMAEGARPAPPGQRVIARLLRARIDEVAVQVGISGERTGEWKPGKGAFDPPQPVIRATLVQLVDDPAARTEIMAGIAQYTAGQFRDGAAVAVSHLESDDDAFATAFNLPTKRVGHLNGLLAESLLEARAQDMAAGKGVVTVLRAAATMAQGATGAGPVTGLTVDAAMAQAERLVTTDVPKVGALAFENELEDIAATSLERAMTLEQRARLLSNPAEPVGYFVDDHIVVPEGEMEYRRYRAWLERQDLFYTKVRSVQQMTMGSWDLALLERIT